MAPGDRLLMTEYGYLFMRTLAKLVGATVDIAPEPDYRVDVDQLLHNQHSQTRLPAHYHQQRRTHADGRSNPRRLAPAIP